MARWDWKKSFKNWLNFGEPSGLKGRNIPDSVQLYFKSTLSNKKCKLINSVWQDSNPGQGIHLLKLLFERSDVFEKAGSLIDRWQRIRLKMGNWIFIISQLIEGQIFNCSFIRIKSLGFDGQLPDYGETDMGSNPGTTGSRWIQNGLCRTEHLLKH